MSIYISLLLNIYHVIHLVLWASHCQSSKWHAFNKTMLRTAAFLIIWTGSSKQDTTPFTKGTRGNCVRFGQEAKGKPCTWNVGYHALGVCQPKQNTITYFNRATTNIYENHIKIHRIMMVWKSAFGSRETQVHTFLLATECLDHTQNKLKLFTMFPNVFFIFPSTFNY